MVMQHEQTPFAPLSDDEIGAVSGGSDFLPELDYEDVLRPRYPDFIWT